MINIQNIEDNECFKWWLVRYLNPTDRYPARFTKTDKDFAENLDFKDIKFPVKVWDIHKIGIKNSIGIRVFGYKNKEKYPIYDMLLIGEEGKRNYVLSYMIILYIVEKKHFCRYCLELLVQKKYQNLILKTT